MPSVTKQSPLQKKTPTSKSGSLLDRASPIGFDTSDGIKVLLYGQSGTGKTTIWSTFPAPILALICSGGDKSGELRSVDTAENRKRIKQATVLRSSEITGLVDALNAGEGNYQTVVLDHASGLQDKVLAEILGVDKLPEQKGWGVASQQQYGQCTLLCKEILRALLGLDCNVVVVAQERVFNGSDEGSGSDMIKATVGAGLTPSLAGWLNTAADYIVQTFKRQKEVTKQVKINGKVLDRVEKTKGVEYCLRTGPDATYTTKFRKPRGVELPDVIVDADYTKIMKLIQE